MTNSLGEPKATAEGETYMGNTWGGNDGIQPQTWSPGQPNIEEGDWVYARTDDGKTAQVHIGVITGVLDLLDDRISGTISAPFTTPLRTICQLWVDNAPPQIAGSVDPSGGSYSCSWAGIYDIQPDMNVAVSYFEPDNDQIINVFSIGRSSIYINKWGNGQPGEGGRYIFHINYVNQGNGPADDVVITDTLSEGMTYLGNTAPFSLTSTSPLVWDLGNLPAWSNATFDLYVQVDAPS